MQQVTSIMAFSLIGGVGIIGIACILLSSDKIGRFAAAGEIMLGIAIIALPSVEYVTNIHVEEVEGEYIVSESQRVMENGLDIRTAEDSIMTSYILMNTTPVPMVTGGGTSTVYTVMVEGGDGGVDTRTFSIGSLTVYEDVDGWEEARLDEVLTVEARYTGTFFGRPVSDIKTSGNMFPDYQIHVPKGTLERING